MSTPTTAGSPASASSPQGDGDRLEVEDLRPARDHDQVGDLRRLEGGRFGPGRRVDDDEIDVLLRRGVDRVPETRRLNVGHHRGIHLPAVPPLAGARLRVGVEDDDGAALVDSLDGEREGDAGLADTAFLREQGDDLHVYTVLQIYMSPSQTLGTSVGSRAAERPGGSLAAMKARGVRRLDTLDAADEPLHPDSEVHDAGGGHQIYGSLQYFGHDEQHSARGT